MGAGRRFSARPASTHRAPGNAPRAQLTGSRSGSHKRAADSGLPCLAPWATSVTRPWRLLWASRPRPSTAGIPTSPVMITVKRFPAVQIGCVLASLVGHPVAQDWCFAPSVKGAGLDPVVSLRGSSPLPDNLVTLGNRPPDQCTPWTDLGGGVRGGGKAHSERRDSWVRARRPPVRSTRSRCSTASSSEPRSSCTAPRRSRRTRGIRGQQRSAGHGPLTTGPHARARQRPERAAFIDTDRISSPNTINARGPAYTTPTYVQSTGSASRA